MIKESLFQPVSLDRFNGREDIIEDVLKYFPSIVSGNPQHFFITGKRGMGKTSLANVISEISKNEFSMVSAHIMNNGVNDIEELVIRIIEEILNSIRSEKGSKKIFYYLKDNIEIGDLTINFKPSDSELNYIKDNFAFYLNDLISNFKDKNGIFIVIDDINSLSDTQEFANWYKSFVDTMATSIDFMPIGIMLTGYPNNFTKLYKQNPSLNRIFHTYEL